MKIAGALALTAIAALAACTSYPGVSVVQNYQTGFYSGSEYAFDAHKGEMPVAVTGSAFGLDPNQLADVTVRNMQGSDFSPHANFTAVPGTNTSRIYHYVMMWNGPEDVTAAQLCANPRLAQPSAPAASAGGEVVLRAGLCRYDKATNGVTASAANVTGPGDVKFRNVIEAAMLELTRPNQQDFFDRDKDSSDSNAIH
ncbi:MAG TPA: hypothetical protein VL966_18210 [Alphaproteobacteria bacterium]|jgi:hypothetical protein|nr:hypothetical protein [Alphaproteobacteria bacterium]